MSRLFTLPAGVLAIRCTLGAAFLTLSTASAAAAQAVPKPAAKPAKAGKSAKSAPKAAKAEATAEKTADKPCSKGDPPPASASPMIELKKSNEKLDKILQKNRPDWSPEAELQRAEVRKVVGSFLDYAELAR